MLHQNGSLINFYIMTLTAAPLSYHLDYKNSSLRVFFFYCQTPWWIRQFLFRPLIIVIKCLNSMKETVLETEIWVVLGSRGYREKKLPTAISKQLFQVVFFNFLWAKEIFKHFLKIFLRPHRKVTLYKANKSIRKFVRK